MKKQLSIYSFIIGFLLLAGCSSKTAWETVSPDGIVKIVFKLKDGAACYSVLYQGKMLVAESHLALELQPGGEWGKQLVAKSTGYDEINDVYNLVVGKSAQAINHCNEMTIALQEKARLQRRIDLVFRAYNDGIAFRYRFPQQPAFSEFEVISEQTEFRFPENHHCWALQLGSYTTSYEKEFDPVLLADIEETAIVGLPLTIEVKDGPALALTEANLTDYAGMYLAGSGTEKTTLVSRLSPLPQDSNVCVRAITPHMTPWRVLMIGEKPGDLIESNIILNLNDPCAINDPSWIKAGKCAWDWWSGQVVDDPAIKSGMNNATIKHYIDFAAENSLEYMLIDAGWEARTDNRVRDITRSNSEINIPELVQYANDRNVDILIWMHWTSVKQQMKDAFALYEQWGLKGVKIDFMDRDDQEMVRFYREMMETAARHHLMIDFHGAYKPTGLRRTYPNVMTREGILGLEYLKWSDRANPEHNVTAPFTRMLAGPMDYTPGGFRNVTKEAFEPQRKNPMVLTSRCHQLALFVVVESPLQMVADAPANYRNQPGLDFLQLVPATWDETRVISGEIGEYIAIARRSDTSWFMGGLTDDQARNLELPLAFLADGEYHLRMWSDKSGKELKPDQLEQSERIVTRQDTLCIFMASGGGFAAYFNPSASPQR